VPCFNHYRALYNNEYCFVALNNPLNFKLALIVLIPIKPTYLSEKHYAA
jgi:hypothetical protein